MNDRDISSIGNKVHEILKSNTDNMEESLMILADLMLNYTLSALEDTAAFKKNASLLRYGLSGENIVLEIKTENVQADEKEVLH
jgi:hypothetical protein